jgi:tetratricopeptide (TPR) repeat protein
VNQERYSTTRALLIGSGPSCGLNLGDPGNTEADVKAVNVVLESHLQPERMAEIRICLTPSSARALAALAWLYDPASSAAAGDLILYYSGHAAMLPSDEIGLVFGDSIRENPASMISAGMLHACLLNCPRASHSWILDCCFSHGLAFNRFPEILKEMVHHSVIASSSSTQRTPAASPDGMSPFTQALIRGIRGFAYAPGKSSLDMLELFDFMCAETSRMGMPQPYLNYSGIGRRLSFRLAGSRGQMRATVAASRRSPGPRLIVALGEPGQHTESFLRDETGLLYRSWELDGRTQAMYEMSKIAEPASTDPARLLGIDALEDAEVWDEAVTQSREKPVVVTVARQTSLPFDISAADAVLAAPTPTTDQADRLLKLLHIENSDIIVNPADLVLQANGSMQELERLAKSLRIMAINKDWQDGDGPVNLSIGHVLRLLDILSPAAGRMVKALAACPGVYLSERSLRHWVAYDRRGPAVARKDIDLAIRHVRNLGLVLHGAGWWLMPTRFASEIQVASRDCDPIFTSYVEYSMTSRTRPRLTPEERFQVARAAVQFCGSRVGGFAGHEHVDRVFSAVGMELFASARRQIWGPLVANIDHWLGTEASGKIGVVLGHAYRLADDYERAAARLNKAAARPMAREDALSVNAALIRLSVQSGGAVSMPPVMAELSAAARSSRWRSSVRYARTQLEVQRASSAYRAGNIHQAEDLYAAVAGRDTEIADVAMASLAVDAWKGIGDVALDLDQRSKARECAVRIIELNTRFELSRYGRVPHAKTLQFLGDVARREAVSQEDPISGFRSRRIDESSYWYRRALAEYQSQELILGELISWFKSAELAALAEDYRKALEDHLTLAERFGEIGNMNWQFRSKMSALKLAQKSSIDGAQALLTAYAGDVQSRISDHIISDSDRLWALIGLAQIDESATADLERACDLAIGSVSEFIISLARNQEWGSWMFAYYSST